jgi:hypothetical protein
MRLSQTTRNEKSGDETVRALAIHSIGTARADFTETPSHGLVCDAYNQRSDVSFQRIAARQFAVVDELGLRSITPSAFPNRGGSGSHGIHARLEPTFWHGCHTVRR